MGGYERDCNLCRWLLYKWSGKNDDGGLLDGVGTGVRGNLQLVQQFWEDM